MQWPAHLPIVGGGGVTLHAPLILKKCQLLLEKTLCNWLLGNRESPIISTCFPCFYHNFMSCININSFSCTINIEKMSIFTLEKMENKC